MCVECAKTDFILIDPRADDVTFHVGFKEGLLVMILFTCIQNEDYICKGRDNDKEHDEEVHDVLESLCK